MNARILWLRWAGNPSHNTVAFCPPRKRRSSSSTPIRLSVLSLPGWTWKASLKPPPSEPKHHAAAIEARFQLNRWTSTGVLPRGAQVERTIGVSETPDSSKKQMAALRRLALFDPGPVAGDPLADRLLVPLDRAAGGGVAGPGQGVGEQAAP